jgi:hypothetical protein
MAKAEPQPEGKAEAQLDGQAKTPSDSAPQIAKRAYEIHEERGQQSDPAVQDWEQAEKEIRRDQTKGSLRPGAKVEAKPESRTKA